MRLAAAVRTGFFALIRSVAFMRLEAKSVTFQFPESMFWTTLSQWMLGPSPLISQQNGFSDVGLFMPSPLLLLPPCAGQTDKLDLCRRFMVSCCNCLRLLMDLATRSRLIGKSQLHIAWSTPLSGFTRTRKTSAINKD